MENEKNAVGFFEQVLPTKSYDNWINLTLIFFLISIFIIQRRQNIIPGQHPRGWETIIAWSIKQNSSNWNGNKIVHPPEMMKIRKIGKWHRSHGKLVHYQDQITRPPFWDMWHMRRQSTSNDSLTFISHQCVVPKSIFLSHFSRRPAPSTKSRQQTSQEKIDWTLYKKWTQFPC